MTGNENMLSKKSSIHLSYLLKSPKYPYMKLDKYKDKQLQT